YVPRVKCRLPSPCSTACWMAAVSSVVPSPAAPKSLTLAIGLLSFQAHCSAKVQTPPLVGEVARRRRADEGFQEPMPSFVQRDARKARGVSAVDAQKCCIRAAGSPH